MLLKNNIFTFDRTFSQYKTMAPRKKEENLKIQERSQQKIMEAAFELFAQNGYQATSIENIASKARISKGLIYHYFNGKQEILKKIIHDQIDKLPQLMTEGEQTLPEAYIHSLIEHAFHFMLHHTKINRFLIALAIQPKVVEGLKEELEEAKLQWMNKLAEMFEKLNYENPMAEAYLLGALFDGVSIGYHVFGEEYPIDAIKEKILKRYQLKKQ